MIIFKNMKFEIMFKGDVYFLTPPREFCIHRGCSGCKYHKFCTEDDKTFRTPEELKKFVEQENAKNKQ